jgi:glycine/D-amino acid oxidase-like deaminating enzyme
MELPLTERSLWRESYHHAGYPQLSHDIHIDVVIVGAGITGLSAAYLLKQEGKTVAVLDKDTVGGGTTGRTTGKVTSQHNLIYDTLIKKHGEVVARQYADANSTAVEKVAQIIEKEKIECDWERDDNYVYTTSDLQVETFRKEAEAAQRLGLPASYETTSSLPFEIKAAVRFKNQGKINAQSYVTGLAAAVHGDGSYVYEHSNVIGIRDGEMPRVKTLHGSVFAQDIIVATNVPTLPLLARGEYCSKEYPTESYIVAGELPHKQAGMYISPDKHQYSILPVKAEGKRMLLIGGEGHMWGLRISRAARYKRLAEYAERHFGMTKITYKWSDRDYLAYDNIPLIGKVYSWSQHVYVGTGFKKWGLSNGTVAAMILTDNIMGRPNPWASAFDSTRLKKPLLSIPEAVIKETRRILP